MGTLKQSDKKGRKVSATKQQIETALRNRQPFRNSTGTFRAELGKVRSTEHLQDEWLELYQNSSIIYTVMSYGTPIAWVTSNGEIVIPSIYYSNSTSKHQNIVRNNLR